MARSASILLGRLAAVLLVLSALPIVWTWRAARAPAAPALGPQWIRADQILVDLRDNASSVDIQALDAKYGIDLQFNDLYAHGDKLMRATVDPARRDAILAQLQRDPEVEAAEPDSLDEESWTPN